jgi:hypothetical protein
MDAVPPLSALDMRPWIATAVLIISLAAAGLFLFYRPGFGYWHFLARGQGYYARVAQGCDALLTQHPGPVPYKDSGPNIKNLPVALDELHPSLVVVDTNLVSLLIGGGFDGYNVTWSCNEPDSSVWSLKVYRQGRGSRTVFSELKKR